jgi:hypothetical protein
MTTGNSVARGPNQAQFDHYFLAYSTAPTGTQGDVNLYFGDRDDNIQAAIGWDESAQSLVFNGYNNVTAFQVLGAQFAPEDGTAGAPSISFANDLDTGIYRAAANEIAIAAGTSKILHCNTFEVEAQVPFRAQDGSVSAPSFAFATDTNTGMYLASTTTGTMRFSVQGTNILQIASGNLSPVPAGTVDCGLAAARWATYYGTNADDITSDMRLKDRTGDAYGLAFVQKLEPFAGRWKTDPAGDVHQWLSAQNVAEALGDDAEMSGVWHDHDGEQSLAYTELIPVLVRAVQELAEKVDA